MKIRIFISILVLSYLLSSCNRSEKEILVKIECIKKVGDTNAPYALMMTDSLDCLEEKQSDYIKAMPCCRYALKTKIMT